MTFIYLGRALEVGLCTSSWERLETCFAGPTQRRIGIAIPTPIEHARNWLPVDKTDKEIHDSEYTEELLWGAGRRNTSY